MTEWWTYRPDDFLMFAPRTYWRLIESYNRDLWPLHGAALLAGVALAWLAARRGGVVTRAVAAVLALAWLWVGWAFHWQRYATINWGARYFALGYVLQACLLLLLAVLHRRAAAGAPREWVRRCGLLLTFAGVVAYPALAPLAGRPWTQAEVFGLAGEPTALATLGLVLVLQPRHAGWLAVIPALSLLLGAATQWLLAR